MKNSMVLAEKLVPNKWIDALWIYAFLLDLAVLLVSLQEMVQSKMDFFVMVTTFSFSSISTPTNHLKVAHFIAMLFTLTVSLTRI